MKICVQPPQPALSRSLQRIADALTKTAPADATLVPTAAEADLTVHYALGSGTVAAIAQDRLAGRPYAMVQCCLASSDLPNPAAWQPLWQGAVAVWSYLHLPLLGYYHRPLGVDQTVFYPRQFAGRTVPRPYLLATTGYVAKTECLQECADAVAACGGLMVHLGPDLGLGDHVTVVHDLADQEWAEILSLSRFVAGLRRIEGFELPVLEGAACGATPVVFDTPCYDWMDRFAWRIPEGSPAFVTAALTRILSRVGAKADPERDDPDDYLAPFDWDVLTSGFWERVLQGVS